MAKIDSIFRELREWQSSECGSEVEQHEGNLAPSEGQCSRSADLPERKKAAEVRSSEYATALRQYEGDSDSPLPAGVADAMLSNLVGASSEAAYTARIYTRSQLLSSEAWYNKEAARLQQETHEDFNSVPTSSDSSKAFDTEKRPTGDCTLVQGSDGQTSRSRPGLMPAEPDAEGEGRRTQETSARDEAALHVADLTKELERRTTRLMALSSEEADRIYAYVACGRA